MKSFYVRVFLCVAVLAGAHASMADDGDDRNLAAVFSPYAEKASFHISYDDWSYILNATVFDAGRSDRSYWAVPVPETGRHSYRGNTSSTRFEGNRIHLPAFKGDNFTALHQIRRELEALPDAVPLQEWTRNQQLAYWLNLYNLTMVEELARVYPKTALRTYLYGKKGRGDGFLDQKVLTVAGVPLSLNDIHHRILIPVWNDPLVMYGLFHGYVGAANIRKEAYTAGSVYQQLRDNAAEFINSNRGLRAVKSRIEVAELYRIDAALFPDFDADLKAHLMAYADPGYSARIAGAGTVEPVTRDYYVADLFQGVNSDVNPSLGSAAVGGLMPEWVGDRMLANRSMLTGSIPFVAVDYATKIAQKKAKRAGKVTVEEFDEGEPSRDDETLD